MLIGWGGLGGMGIEEGVAGVVFGGGANCGVEVVDGLVGGGIEDAACEIGVGGESGRGS